MNVKRSRQITDSGMTFDIIQITQIRPRSPAARAGFHPDDQIIAVDGRVFPSIAVFGAYIAALAPGSQATVDYVPAGEGPSNAQRVTVALGAAASPSSGTTASGLTTGQKVAIGVGAAALLGCYELGCFSPRQPPAQPSPLPGR